VKSRIDLGSQLPSWGKKCVTKGNDLTMKSMKTMKVGLWKSPLSEATVTNQNIFRVHPCFPWLILRKCAPLSKQSITDPNLFANFAALREIMDGFYIT
jgi:hypothetical protein